MRENLEKILNYAINAPSGDNLQPWRFGIKENNIYLFNLPEKDTSLYNFKQFGSMVGHGALIENIIITATKFGYEAKVETLPKGTASDLVAVIHFSLSETKPHYLYPAIALRTTNRKPYQDKLLDSDQKQDLLSVQENGGRLVLLEDKGKKNIVAKALSVSERLILENQHVHKFLFEHIVWTSKEEAVKKAGLYVKTMELSPGQENGFRMFRNWKLVRILNKFGLSKMLARTSSALYGQSAAIGAILIPGNSEKDFILAGRLMERVWLKATYRGLSIQPITAVTFLKQRLLAGAVKELSDSDMKQVEIAYGIIKDNLNLSTETLGMMFRIGKDGEPSARSSKQPPVILSDKELNSYI